ncbi:MAG TPA: hypothetical protein VNC50_01290 [Planctomycetia bacterium]|nr:hypothetical protein [Planctomycetia bacterium]
MIRLLRLQMGGMAALLLVAAAMLAPAGNPTPADKKLAKDASTWDELLSEKDVQNIIGVYATDMKKALKSKGSFNSAYKKTMQQAHALAALGNIGTVRLKGDDAKKAAALREAGMELAAAAKAKKFDDAKAAFAKIEGYPAKTEPAAAGEVSKWDDVIPLGVLMENVSRIDSEMRAAIKTDAEFKKGAKDAAVKTKLLAALAVIARESKTEGDWQGWCDDMRAGSVDLSKEFAGKDFSGAKKANDVVQKSCTECHKKYQEEK